jgi:hypothetical protein
MPDPRTYTGGCHCRRVRYEVTTALQRVIACNCSMCSKRGSLLTSVPFDRFAYTKGSDEDLTVYQFNKHVINHMFCPVCGILPFVKGIRPNGKPMVGVNARSLDDVDVSALEIKPFDGRSL